MKPVISAAAFFICCATSMGASADDFSDAFGRVKSVWNNVHSFQDKAWTTINDMLSSTSAAGVDQAQQNFWNNDAPQEIFAASKTAFGQLFPNVASALSGQWGDAQATWENTKKLDDQLEQWASQAQNNAQANLDSLGQKFSDLQSQIGDYFGGSASESPQGGNPCAIFAGGVCPACPNGPSDANGNCPPISAQAPNSITSTDLASIGASNTGAAAAAPSSLAAAAQNLPGQLSTWDQQQAALAAERERQRQLELQRLQAQEAAQEQARQQRELQAAETYVQSQNAAEADTADTSDTQGAQPQSSGNSWGNILIQGIGLASKMLGAHQSKQQTPSNSRPTAVCTSRACACTGPTCAVQ